MTFVQRFGSALNVNVHFHALLLDGVYVDDSTTAAPRFVEARRPDDSDVKSLVETIATRVLRLLVKRGFMDDEELAPSPLVEESPALAQLTTASPRTARRRQAPVSAQAPVERRHHAHRALSHGALPG